MGTSLESEACKRGDQNEEKKIECLHEYLDGTTLFDFLIKRIEYLTRKSGKFTRAPIDIYLPSDYNNFN